MILIQQQRSYPKKDYSTNQTQLSRNLGLTTKVLKYLRDTNVLVWKKVGVSVMYETNSINKFLQSFKRVDYFLYRECTKELDRLDYTSFYHGGTTINPLSMYINVKSLINGNEDIPSKYKLSIKQFGSTQFISKKSFKKTLKWLHNENERVNPTTPKDFVLERTAKGGSGVKSFGRKKPKFRKSK